MTGRTRSNEEWLHRQIGFLSQWGDEVGPISPVVHRYSAHTGLKLAALNHAIGVFSPIARANVDKGIYDASIFLDLFAGCGVTRIPETGDYLAGSPIIAAHARPAFDRILAIEQDGDHALALEQRLSHIRPTDFRVIRQDCNSVDVRRLIAPAHKPIVFVCVDPEGMEILWDTMERVSGAVPAADFLVNLTFGAEREAAAAASTGRQSPKLEGLMGRPLREILSDPDGRISRQYERQVQEVLGKQVGGSSLVCRPDGQPLYRILVYARRTRSGSPWGKGYKDIERRLSTVTPDHVRGGLHEIKGRTLVARARGTGTNP